jgi:hypothetical protein
MSNEISEEAKQAIIDASTRKARERLTRDGATSDDALRRRVRAIAEERNIPPADYAKLLHKRITTGAVMAFGKKHKISFDWLLAGDLKGLRRMTQEAKAAAAQEMPEAPRKEVMRLFSALPPRMQTIALGCMEELLARGHL